MYPEPVRAVARNSLSRGASVSEVSRALGVARSTVRDWRDRPADVRSPSTCARCFGASPWPAPDYAALLGFYLGDGCLSTHDNKVVLRVTCDAKHPAIVDDVSLLMARFARDRSVFHVQAPGCIVVQCGWKHWLCLFPQHGPGRKHDRRIDLEDWQTRIIDTCPADFLRGLFHSDGCRLINTVRRAAAGGEKVYSYPRWQFSNRSEEILGLCSTTLDRLGIAWRRSSKVHISVSRHEAVAALDEAIGLKA